MGGWLEEADGGIVTLSGMDLCCFGSRTGLGAGTGLPTLAGLGWTLGGVLGGTFWLVSNVPRKDGSGGA